MAWFYEIPDGNGDLVATSGGFATQDAAMAKGNAEAVRLAQTGNIPGSGLGTLTVGEDSDEPWQQRLPTRTLVLVDRSRAAYHPSARKARRKLWTLEENT
jgi:hypothetical protein